MSAVRPLRARRAVSGATAFGLLLGSSALLVTAVATSAEAVQVSGVNCRTLSTTKPWNAPTTDEPTHSLPDITVSIGTRSGSTVPVTVSYVEGPGIGPVSVPAGALQAAATLVVTGATASSAVATAPPFGAIIGTAEGGTTGNSTRVPPATMTVNVTASGSGPVSVELQSIGFDYTPFTWPGSLGAVDTVCNKGADPFLAAAAPIGLTAAEAGFVATKPGAPTGVSAVAKNASATVSWNAPASNGGANITDYTVTSTPGSKTCTTNGATSCTVTGLTNGTAYQFSVVATNSEGDGPASALSSAVTPSAPTKPSAPTGVSAVAGAASATVSWDAPASDGGSDITGYTVTSSPDEKTCTSIATRSCVVSGLTNGTAYTFTVVATNAEGDSDASSPSAAVTPTAASQSPTPTPTPTATGVSASLTCTTLGQNQAWSTTWSASLTGTKINVAFVPGPANGPVPINDKGLQPMAQITTPSTVDVEGAPYGALDAREVIPGTTMTGSVSGTPTTIGITKVVFKDIGSGSNVDTTCMPDAAIDVPVLSSPPLPDTLPTSTGDLTVNPTAVTAGGKVTLSGGGFAAGSNATAGMYSTPTTLGVGTANAEGAISVDVTIPSGTTGSHTLILLGTDESGGVVALTKTVTVTASTSTPTPTDTSTSDPTDDPDNNGTLPQTGPADFGMTLVWALVALQVGLIIAVRASRSRRPAAESAGRHRR